jgi:D-inositol-3-phosphate glycosyltransferase
LEVGHRISFTGKRSLAELAFAYLAADVLLLPTHKDTWGKVLVEAALAGLPFVTTSACGAAGSLVEDGRTGLVIPPEDPTALAKSMQRLLDPALRRRLGDQARNFVLDFCDPDKEALGYSTAILAAANAAGSANN